MIGVLLKVTQLSQEVEPIVSSIDGVALKKAEEVGIKDRVVEEWIDRLKSEGSHLLTYAVKLLLDFENEQTRCRMYSHCYPRR